MLKITLQEKERTLLHKAKSRTDIPSERITIILLCDSGMKATEIAQIVNLNTNTVRSHIKAYLESSIEGLSRVYSPGRPSTRDMVLIPFLEKCLKECPSKYGWDKVTWDSVSIIASFKKDSNITISHDTVTRAMKSLGYSYKKPQKSPSINAPSKEDKIKTIKNVIYLIKNDLENNDADIYCSDESHFTNEPYLPRGYFKKGTQSANSWPKKAGDKEPFWFIESSEWKVFLEKR